MDRFSLIVGFVGIASFILAIPLAIAANLLTPRVREWWSNSSRTRVVARLQELNAQLEWVDSLTESDALAVFLRSAMAAFVCAFGMIVCFLGLIGINEIYLAARNGWQLDGPVNLNALLVEARVAGFGAVIFEIAWFSFLALATKRFKYISTKSRARVKTKLQGQQEALCSSLEAGVDNSGSNSETPT